MRFEHVFLFVAIPYMALMPIFSLVIGLPVRLSMALSLLISLALLAIGWKSLGKLTRPPERRAGQRHRRDRKRIGNRRERRSKR